MSKEKKKIQTEVQDAGRDERYAQLSGEGSTLEIVVEEAPVTVSSMMPDYRYRFSGHHSPSSGDAFLDDFHKFVAANEYLAMADRPSRAFAAGFARAAAIAALYLDSLELNSR